MAEMGYEIGLLWADDADLNGIYQSIEILRPEAVQVPGLMNAIEDFEKWYQSLSYLDTHIMINDTMAEAVRRRDAILKLRSDFMNLPVDQTLVDRLKTGKPGNVLLPGPKPPLIPEKYKMAAVITGAALGTLIVLKKLYII